jgi:hypothetical protein
MIARLNKSSRAGYTIFELIIVMMIICGALHGGITGFNRLGFGGAIICAPLGGGLGFLAAVGGIVGLGKLACRRLPPPTSPTPAPPGKTQSNEAEPGGGNSRIA